MTTTLWFDLAAVLNLAEHAHAAPEKMPSVAEYAEERACPGALIWAADTGTYLMSGGTPNLRSDPDDPGSNIAVYAEGWGPDSDRNALGDTDIGHDDFVEHLHLGDGDPPLIELLRRGVAAGHRWFVLGVTDTDLTVGLARDQPAPS